MDYLGTLSYICEQEEPHTKVFQKRNKKWTGWKPITEEQTLKFKKVTEKNDSMEECLATFLKNIENAAKSNAPNGSTKRKNNEYSRECQVA